MNPTTPSPWNPWSHSWNRKLLWISGIMLILFATFELIFDSSIIRKFTQPADDHREDSSVVYSQLRNASSQGQVVKYHPVNFVAPKWKISSYIIIYNDFDFIDFIFDKVIDYLDEVILVDGPYGYSTELLKATGLYYEKSTRPAKFRELERKYSKKIKYHYRIWKDEKEKRIFGYNQCVNDLVLLLDGDEIIIPDGDHLNKFIDSDRLVSYFEIYNMNRYNYYHEHANKMILFKRRNVSAPHHLSYTWLVGVDGLDEMRLDTIYRESTVGVIYHHTINRRPLANFLKFIFYNSLYSHVQNRTFTLIGRNVTELLSIITVDQFKDVLYRKAIDSIGMPNQDPNDRQKILHLLPNASVDMSQFSNHQDEAYFHPNQTVLSSLPNFFYLPSKYVHDNILNITITTNNIAKSSFAVYELCLERLFVIHHIPEMTPIQNQIFLSVALNLTTADRIGIIIMSKSSTNSGIVGTLVSIHDTIPRG